MKKFNLKEEFNLIEFVEYLAKIIAEHLTKSLEKLIRTEIEIPEDTWIEFKKHPAYFERVRNHLKNYFNIEEIKVLFQLKHKTNNRIIIFIKRLK